MRKLQTHEEFGWFLFGRPTSVPSIVMEWCFFLWKNHRTTIAKVLDWTEDCYLLASHASSVRQDQKLLSRRCCWHQMMTPNWTVLQLTRWNPRKNPMFLDQNGRPLLILLYHFCLFWETCRPTSAHYCKTNGGSSLYQFLHDYTCNVIQHASKSLKIWIIEVYGQSAALGFFLVLRFLASCRHS